MAASILAVDDSPSMRQMVSFTLQSAGYDVVMANDGVEALKIAEESPDVNLVLTDVNMPNMDGIEFLRNVKADATLKDLPIVMITTEGSKTKVMEAVELGAAGYVRKPFTAEQIKEKLSGLY